MCVCQSWCSIDDKIRHLSYWLAYWNLYNIYGFQGDSNETTEVTTPNLQYDSQCSEESFNKNSDITQSVKNITKNEEIDLQSGKSASACTESNEEIRDKVLEDRMSESSNTAAVSSDSGIESFSRDICALDKPNSSNEELRVTFLETANCESGNSGNVICSSERGPSRQSCQTHGDLVSAIGTKVENPKSSCKVSNNTLTKSNAELPAVGTSGTHINQLDQVNDPENAIAALKNISYDVDDFLNTVITKPRFSPRFIKYPGWLDY